MRRKANDDLWNSHMQYTLWIAAAVGTTWGQPLNDTKKKKKNQLKWKANRRCSMLLNLKCTRGITCETQERRRRKKNLNCVVVLCKLARIARPMRARARVKKCLYANAWVVVTVAAVPSDELWEKLCTFNSMGNKGVSYKLPATCARHAAHKQWRRKTHKSCVQFSTYMKPLRISISLRLPFVFVFFSPLQFLSLSCFSFFSWLLMESFPWVIQLCAALRLMDLCGTSEVLQ